MVRLAELTAKFRSIWPLLNEGTRRLLAASEAKALCRRRHAIAAALDVQEHTSDCARLGPRHHPVSHTTVAQVLHDLHAIDKARGAALLPTMTLTIALSGAARSRRHARRKHRHPEGPLQL